MYRIFVSLTMMLCSSIASGQEPLRTYAGEIGLNIGVCMGRQFDLNNQTHNDLVKREFNMVVAENSMKAINIHPSKGRLEFSGPDKLVQFAQDNGMRVRGHTLVWHSQNAAWICTGDRKTTLENMKYHIDTVVGHFKGKVHHWDVVNEAFADNADGALRSSAWTESIGEDFIDSAFVYAHAADPGCKLFYNDYSIETINGKSTGVYNKIKKMKENGIPIHGIGFQSHRSTSDAVSAFYGMVKENFTRFAEFGLEIAITELDARGSDFTAQAQVYSDFMKIALEMPEVNTFMIWGVRDQDSWLSPTPLIFDNSWQPKPAYFAIQELLKNPPEEEEPVAVLYGRNRVNAAAYRNAFTYNTRTRMLLFADPSIGATTLEFFNLRGARTSIVTLPSGNSLPLATLKLPSGTAVVRAQGMTVRVNTLQGR